MNKENIIKLEQVQDYNRLLGVETLHPLVSMTDLSQLKSIKHCRKNFGFYCVFFKELDCGTILYGRSKYDYQEGTMLFISPGQIAGVDDGGETLNPKGHIVRMKPYTCRNEKRLSFLIVSMKFVRNWNMPLTSIPSK